MSINFPNSPTVGQLYPAIAVPGQPQYIWDGTSWNSGVASPVEALALNGMQINGDMQISQELGIGGNRTTNGYLVDGWVFGMGAASGSFTAQHGTTGTNIPRMIFIYVNTALPSPVANDYIYFFQPIEGYRILRLGFGTASAQPMTIAFWTAHHRTGLYSVSIRNAACNRSYVTTYTQNVADIWEYKTITIPGDTAGTWNVDNTVGMFLGFAVVAGTNFTAPVANSWLASGGSGYLAAPGQVNCAAATSDVLRLTGITLLPGSAAPSQVNQPFCFRPYDQELLLCRRYFITETFTAGQLWMAPIDLTNIYRRTLYAFIPPMRAAPSMVVTGGCTGTFGASQPNVNLITPTSCELTGDLTGAGFSYILSLKADARL